MSDTDRVRAWRDRLKQEGRVAMTIWVTAETKARYEDLALTYHRSPSELVQQALDAYRPDQATGADTVTDTVTDAERLRTLIRTEMVQFTNDVTATITATVTDTLMVQLQDLVQATISAGASVSVTDAETVTGLVPAAETDTATVPPPRETVVAPVTGAVTDTETDTEPIRRRRRPPTPPPTVADTAAARPPLVPAPASAPPRRPGRPIGPLRQRILTLLQAHPEGLNAEEIRVYLKVDKPIGDTLQGMRKAGVITAHGQRPDVRYVVA